MLRMNLRFTVIVLFITILIPGCMVKKKDEKIIEYTPPVLLGYSLRTLSNPYYEYGAAGARRFADWINDAKDSERVQFEALEHFGDDENQLEDIKRIIAKGGRNVILIVDPNRVDNVYEISRICEEAHIYWSTIWTRPEDIHPKDLTYYVCHQEIDDIVAGYKIAQILFDSFTGKEHYRIFAIGGDPENSASKNRIIGLHNALNDHSNIDLIGLEYAHWDPKESLTIIKKILIEEGAVDGIWVANDGMALGVIDALKTIGLNSKISVVSVDGIAIDAIKSGDLLVSYSTRPWVQAGYAAAITYGVYKGDILKEKMSDAEMSFYIEGALIDQHTVDSFEQFFVNQIFKMDFNDPFAPVDREIGKAE